MVMIPKTFEKSFLKNFLEGLSAVASGLKVTQNFKKEQQSNMVVAV